LQAGLAQWIRTLIARQLMLYANCELQIESTSDVMSAEQTSQMYCRPPSAPRVRVFFLIIPMMSFQDYLYLDIEAKSCKGGIELAV
jgi:hypothetical protein